MLFPSKIRDYQRLTAYLSSEKLPIELPLGMMNWRPHEEVLFLEKLLALKLTPDIKGTLDGSLYRSNKYLTFRDILCLYKSQLRLKWGTAGIFVQEPPSPHCVG